MENVANTPDTISIQDAARASHPQNHSASRNRNLEILTAYIQRQRALLDRIKQDVDRLQAARADAAVDPSSTLTHILHDHNSNNCGKHGESKDGVSGGDLGLRPLSELVTDVNGDGGATITKDIEWDVFKGHDIAALQSPQPWSSRTSLVPSGTHSHSHSHSHMPPPPTPSTPSLTSPRPTLASFVGLDREHKFSGQLSPFHEYLREKAKEIVEPALKKAAQYLASFPDSDDEDVKPAAKTKDARRGKPAADSRPEGSSSTNGHVNKKSASRRKSEASAAAAALRPRGQGGRFKKKEQVPTEVPAPRPQTDGASTSMDASNLASALIASTSESHIHDSASNAQQQSTSEVRPQRVRRPSTRYGFAAPSVSSAGTSRSGSTGSAIGNGNRNGKTPIALRLPSSSPIITSGEPRTRLTIRIPARRPAKSNARNDGDYQDRQPSASTPRSATGSLVTANSTSTNVTVPAEIDDAYFGGKLYAFGQPGQHHITAGEDESRASSPATTTRSTSQLGSFNVKQEEDDQSNGMDVDNEAEWDTIDKHMYRYRQSSVPDSYNSAKLVKYEESEENEEDNHDGQSDSDDSFVCERLPPLPTSSASSSSASRRVTNGNGNMNGNGNSKATESRGFSRRGNPSSKTFNMTWSDEEQRLLDMLLEQFPDGTKNRWANISRAMGGTRTARQVASRVQKYFAKMKKWGIDVT